MGDVSKLYMEKGGQSMFNLKLYQFVYDKLIELMDEYAVTSIKNEVAIKFHFSFLLLFNPTLHGGAIMAPPIIFEASQLKQEGLFWFNLHTNLVKWVPTMAKTQKKGDSKVRFFG